MLPGLLTILILTAIAGTTLLTLGLRGRRINDHPICRKCKFDLVGVYPAVKRCPECGRELAAPRSVRNGERIKRRGLLAISLPCLLVALGGGGLFGWATVTTYNWYVVSPDWVLETAAGLADPAKQARAVGELTARFSSGTLDGERIDRLIERGLAIQADKEQRWQIEWGDLIETGIIGGRLTQDQREAYLTNGIDCALEIPGRVRQGELAIVSLEVSAARCGSNATALLTMYLPQLMVGEVALTTSYNFPAGGISFRGDSPPVLMVMCGLSVSPGVAPPTSGGATKIVEIFLKPGVFVLSAQPEFSLTGLSPVVPLKRIRIRREVQAEFEVIPEGTP